MIIRHSAGGDPSYRCQGTNWLWRSADNSGKYRHIVERYNGIDSARPGMLAFKRHGDDVHHVGLVAGLGDDDCLTVIHSSSVQGKVVETRLDASWELLAVHKMIQPMDSSGEIPDKEKPEMNDDLQRRMIVKLESGRLNLRNGPDTQSRIIGKIPNGAVVDIIAFGDWPYIRYNGQSGYVDGKYLSSYDGENDSTASGGDEVDNWGVFVPCNNYEQAQEFARLFSVCVVCRRVLDD